MSYRVLPMLLCMTLASSAAVRAEESGSAAVISAAFSSENYDKGLELIREVFARLQPDQSAQATTLIKSILASVPKDQAGQIVVAAIRGNPSLGTPILNASVSGATRDEQLAILSRVNFALIQHPEQNSELAQHVPEMLNNTARTVPVSVALTSPTFNPANSPSDTKTVISNPDIKEDRQDIRQDLRELAAEQKVLQELRQAGAPRREIKQEERDIRSIRKDLRQDEKDLRHDPRFIGPTPPTHFP